MPEARWSQILFSELGARGCKGSLLPVFSPNETGGHAERVSLWVCPKIVNFSAKNPVAVFASLLECFLEINHLIAMFKQCLNNEPTLITLTHC